MRMEGDDMKKRILSVILFTFMMLLLPGGTVMADTITFGFNTEETETEMDNMILDTNGEYTLQIASSDPGDIVTNWSMEMTGDLAIIAPSMDGFAVFVSDPSFYKKPVGTITVSLTSGKLFSLDGFLCGNSGNDDNLTLATGSATETFFTEGFSETLITPSSAFHGITSFTLSWEELGGDNCHGMFFDKFRITPVTSPPADIALDNASIAENTASGTKVGGLTTDDPDSSTFTYSLVDTATYPDNASFTISGSDLILNTVPDYESKSSYSIRIRTQDDTGQFYDKTFTISVTEFAGGDGVTTPYHIQTAAQLDRVRNHMGASFVLDNDIDLTAACRSGGPFDNGGEGWEPIGTPSSHFTGTFDGNGHTITGLFIDRPDTGDAGLFGDNGGTIRNLMLQDVSITAQYTVGSVAGYNHGTVSNCGAINSSVTSQGQYAGALIGYSDVAITDSYALGGASGPNEVGGLVGYSKGTVTNCYAACRLTGSGDVGGLIGIKGGGAVTNCYYDSTVSGQSDTDKGTGLPTLRMLRSDNFTGFDFSSVWTISEGVTYPYLRSVTPPVLPAPAAGIAVGSQNGTLTGGLSGTATFAATVIGAADGAAVTAAWCDSSGAGVPEPAGLSAVCSDLWNNTSTVTVTADTTTVGDNYYFTVSCNGITSAITLLTVGTATDYAISLSQSGTYAFPTRNSDYPTAPTLDVMVENTGINATGDLTVTLGGANSDGFTLSKSTIASIAAGGSDSFTVAPQAGLSDGAYTATVTVSGGNGITASFDVSFCVGRTIPSWGTDATYSDGETVDISSLDTDAGGTTLTFDGGAETLAGIGSKTYVNLRVVIKGGATVTLQNVHIDNSTGLLSPVDVQDGNAGNTLLLSGANTLTSSDANTALHLPDGMVLTIGKANASDSDNNHTLTAVSGSSSISGCAGIGGRIMMEAGGTLTVTGGTVNASGYGGAGIGGGGYVGGGNVTIAGGIVNASSTSGAGIGGGVNASGGIVTITGGTINTSSTNGAGIGRGEHASGEEVGGGTTTITGGSVNASSISGTPTNGGNPLYLTTVTLNDASGDPVASAPVTALTVTGLTHTYGITGMQTDTNGKLYLYLPADTAVTGASATVSGTAYNYARADGINAGATGTLNALVPLAVTSVSPSGTGVSLTPAISVTFNQNEVNTHGVVKLIDNAGNEIVLFNDGIDSSTHTETFIVPNSRRLSPGTTYTVYISGFADFLGNPMTVDTSHAFTTIPALPAPSGLAWDGKTATWNAVTGASGYSVQFYKDEAPLGDPISVSGTSRDFSLAIAAAGTGSYTFAVTAMGDGTNYESSGASERSAAYSYTAPSGGFAITAFDGFDEPRGVAVDASGYIYVADSNNSAVKRMDADGSNIVTLSSEFSYPCGIAVDGSGNIYVADTYNNAVKRMNADGSDIVTLGSGFSYPYGVAVDASGYIYVADTENNAVKRMNADGSDIVTLGSGFSNPVGIAVDGDGNIYVTDSGNSAIKRMNADGSNIVTLGSGFYYPRGVAVDGSGNIYVADNGNNGVERMNADGSNIVTLGSGFSYPCGVAADGGNVYVADSGNNAVKKIQFTYPVTYDANDGTGTAPTESDKPAGATFPAAAANSFTAPSGKMFKEWNTASDGSGTGYAPGATVTMPAGNLTLYAIWEDIPLTTYTVTYAPNGGTGTAPAESDKPAGATFAAAANSFTAPSGKRFKEWNTASDGSGIAYAPGATVTMPAGNLTLYAIWEDVTYTVTYDANGGTGVAPAESDKTAGATFAAAANSFTAPSGKRFKEWNTASDGSGIAYAPGATVTMPAGSLTLYAVWKTIPISVDTFDGYMITTFAGFSEPSSVAVDGSGSIYVADSGNNAIRKINADGSSIVTLGSGFYWPRGVAVDGSGNIYVADSGNRVIKKMNADGSDIVTLGSGFSNPVGIAVDGSGYIYVADSGNSTVKKMNADGSNIVTLGSGFNVPCGVTVDGSGNIYVADYANSVVKKMNADGSNIVTLGSRFSGPNGVAVDGAGNIYVADYVNSVVKRMNADGSNIVTFRMGFSWPRDVAVDGSGNIYVADSGNSSIKKIQFTDPGVHTVTYDPNGGTGTAPTEIGQPAGATFTAAGNTFTAPAGKWFKEWNTASDGSGTAYAAGATIIMPAGNLTLYAVWRNIMEITTFNGYTITTFAGFSGPSGVAVDASGNIYMADSGNNAIKKLNADGSNIVTLGSGFSEPSSVAVDASGNIYVADSGNSAIKKMNADGSNIVTLGSGFDYPCGVAVDASGNIYVTDGEISEIKKMNADGSNIVTLGSGFNYPSGIAVDDGGNIYVADNGNSAIKKMNADGSNIVTLGSGFDYPCGVAVDASGYIYVADSENSAVKKMNADGSNIVTLGSGFVYPVGIAVDDPGNVYVADSESSTVKKIQFIYTITYDANSGTGTAPAESDKPAGATFAAAANSFTAPAGKRFKEWNTAANGTGTAYAAGATVTMPAGSLTLYAIWESIPDSGNSGGNGGGTGGGGTPVITPPAEQPKTETSVQGNKVTSTITTTATVGNNGKAAAAVTQTQVSNAISKAAEEAARQGNGAAAVVEIKVEAPADAKTVETSLPREAVNLAADGKVEALTVATPVAAITFDANTLSAIAGEAVEAVKITASRVEASSLSAEAQQLVGDRPVFNFSVTSGDKTISQFGGSVSVAVPYTPKAGEDINAIVICYINAEGKAEIVSNCVYDPATGTVRFSTNHFSQYAVGYNKVSFKDVAADALYSKAVGFIAARGITAGTGSGNYSPAAKLTRGEFLVMMMKAYGMPPDGNPKDNFADAGNTHYTGYLAAAKRLGISGGVGNNMFAPGKEITRREMFTLLYNALKVIGQLPQGDSGKTLSDFTDVGQIDSWAKDAMMLLVKTGTVEDSNGALTPLGKATRADMAQVLYKLLSR